MNQVTAQYPVLKSNSIYYILPFAGIYLVYLIGLFIDVMDVDAAQYASMAREMLETGNYLQLFNRYQDYLDKPPLLFWLSAFSFKLFGVSNFAYKLPSFLFSLLGTYATYRLARLYYNKEVAYIAALVLASCQAFFLFNHDVRTDTLLTGAVILAIWQLAQFNHEGKFMNVIWGFAGIALAMLSKGPIGIMVPVLAFTTDFAMKREWKSFFRWQWLAGIVWVGILLLPMCIGLYQQFDLQPEKIVNGQQGVSGLKFFFWTQSFGRITGENTWNNNADIFFFMHTFLWSFLPWSLLFVVAFFKQTVKLISQKLKINSQEEAITWGGFLFPYIALSLSKYQLPHYIFVLFPLAAIITAKYVYALIVQQKKEAILWQRIQIGIAVLLWIVAALLVMICFPLGNLLIWLGIMALFALTFLLYLKGTSRFHKLILPSLIAITGVNFALNAHVYPTLFTYQSPTVAARYVVENNIDRERFYAYQTHIHSLDFYSRKIIPIIPDATALSRLNSGQPYWIYTNTKGLADIQSIAQQVEVIKTFDHFHISMLTLPFLNPNTRANVVEKRFLVKVGG